MVFTELISGSIANLAFLCKRSGIPVEDTKSHEMPQESTSGRKVHSTFLMCLYLQLLNFSS